MGLSFIEVSSDLEAVTQISIRVQFSRERKV